MSNLTQQQNVHLTFKANKGIGRHDWLRLTPAYSVHLVEKELEKYPQEAVIFDPFSGTGTTGLCAAQKGHDAVLADVNPFLIWLAETKSYNYTKQQIDKANQKLSQVLNEAKSSDGKNLWTPALHNIERWWSKPKLDALARIKAAIEPLSKGKENDLLLVAFCDTLIKHSNAAFNHQSMSFRDIDTTQEPDKEAQTELFAHYEQAASKIIENAKTPLLGQVKIVHTDSRNMKIPGKVDVVITSPPYVNRMSYIRELRPYMYWLRFLNEAKEAGELDWKAIGGTWGIATSKLNNWQDKRTLPIKDIQKITNKIAEADSKNGRLLSNYVLKYFHDMWEHFEALHNVVNKGGEIVYIIGNSTFYDNVVPAEKWYAELMESVGFKNVSVETIRKRNSHKALYEFAVRAKR